jgi:acetyltransferase
MVRAASAEFMCGLSRDPVFGPVIVVGAGGGAVEELGDLVHCLTPLSEEKARDAVRSLRAHAAMATIDPERADTLQRGLVATMGALAAMAESASRVAEVDLNPVVLDEGGELVALDALVVLR